MTALVAVLCIAVFASAFVQLQIVRIATDSVTTASGVVAALRDPALDDAAREATAQQATRRLLYLFGVIVVRSFIALVAGLVPVGLGHMLEVAPAGAVFAFLSRVDVIVVTLLVVTAVWILGRRVRT